jgi:exodeoxyribonuclease-3
MLESAAQGRLIIVIATWNVNSIRARMAHALSFLQARKPDVLLMQELKGLEFPADDFRALGYESAAIGQKSYNGVAVLSRLPIEMVTNRLAGDDEDTHARFLETIIDTPSKLRVVNIYLPNGNPIGTEKFFYKLQWMDRLIQQMMQWTNDPIPTIIGGDFNVIPEDIDCDKPANWVRDALFQPEPRDRYRAMQAMGWVDAFRTLHPGEGSHFTYWDYFRQAFERNRGIRIDHFLLSPSLAPRLQGCEIDKTPRAQEKPSDHTPVLVTLN